MSSKPGVAASSEQATGTRDETYNLVSLLYYVLQGAQTTMQYVQDAKQAGDQELVQFLRDAQAAAMQKPVGSSPVRRFL
jgi:hypothetical protein